jgi:hypothetical protein
VGVCLLAKRGLLSFACGAFIGVAAMLGRIVNTERGFFYPVEKY